MSTPVRAGLWLGVLVVGWMFVMGVTGWYKDPVLGNLFFLVILLEIGLLVWMLRQTAAQGATYGRQIGHGLVFALVSSVLIFVGSYVFTTVAFPTYFDDVCAMQAQVLRARGVSEAEVAAQMKAAAPLQTPFMNALSGVIGTVVTAIAGSAVAGFFIRKK
jgi:hypothetical protein